MPFFRIIIHGKMETLQSGGIERKLPKMGRSCLEDLQNPTYIPTTEVTLTNFQKSKISPDEMFSPVDDSTPYPISVRALSEQDLQPTNDNLGEKSKGNAFTKKVKVGNAMDENSMKGKGGSQETMPLTEQSYANLGSHGGPRYGHYQDLK